MSDVEIRPTTPADLNPLADVLVQVHAVDGYPVEGVDDPRAWVELPDSLGQWTALLGGTPTGHVALTRCTEGDPAVSHYLAQGGSRCAQFAAVSRLFVDKNSRGKSLASRLMDAAESKAREEGLQLILQVMAKDRQAVRMYESRGWRFLGKFDHATPDGGRFPALAYCLPGIEQAERPNRGPRP
ncbi:GNAT family N-acetyltransferase [Janibacter limosus]|uniref:GNAT family N-acetyltransferase n=1 Tax=Janibacter limosus TaxID=53458 RepID=UPI0009FC7D39